MVHSSVILLICDLSLVVVEEVPLQKCFLYLFLLEGGEVVHFLSSWMVEVVVLEMVTLKMVEVELCQGVEVVHLSLREEEGEVLLLAVANLGWTLMEVGVQLL